MFFRLQGARRAFWVLPRIYDRGSNVSAFSHVIASWGKASRSVCKSFGFAGLQPFVRYGSVPDTEHQKSSRLDIMSFIGSSFSHPRGDCHCWLNVNRESGNFVKENGVFLVLVGEYFEASLEASQHAAKMFANAKLLQQRYPSLQILALQYTNSTCFSGISADMLRRIMKEYVTFPILFCNKNAIEFGSVPCYIISEGLKDHLVYPGENVDIKLLYSAISDLNMRNAKEAKMDVLIGSWVKPLLVVKEPDVCSASRSLLFSFPSCISIDETGDRFFLSDVNHHRIIVLNSSGKFLDAIGSSPGFEDGDFENAKIMRPAASMYHASEDLLYFVDSENHAIRRADMSKRIVETVFPSNDGNTKSNGLWSWIMDRIWKKKNPRIKSQELNAESFSFPWHILKSSDNNLFVLNQSCEVLWILDMELGFIQEVVKGSSKILEICQQMIQDKCMPLNHLPSGWLHRRIAASCPTKGPPYACLMSSVANHLDNIIFCDAVGQNVVKFKKGSTSPENFEFSNFGVLGVPYWLRSSVEKVYSIDDDTCDADHSQCFNLLPGIVNIELNVDIPRDTRLVEHPREGSVWCQTRGAAVKDSGAANKAQSLEKVSPAQQWYDELDNFALEEAQDESSRKQNSLKPSSTSHSEMVQDGKVRIHRTIKTSPGTSEAIIDGAIYLRLEKNGDSDREKKAERIAEILEPKSKWKQELVIESLSASDREIEDIIFVKSLHVRLKFTTGDHPKSEDNTKLIVLTDSSVKVDITL